MKNQVTVEQLYLHLKRLVDAGMGYKKVVIADDNEGNGYHGMYFFGAVNPQTIQDCIEASNGLIDSEETACSEIVIIG